MDGLFSTTEVIKPIKRTVTLLLIRIALTLFLIDSLYAILLWVAVSGYISADMVISFAAFLWVTFIVKCLMLSYGILKMVSDWSSTSYYVADGHLIRQRGVLSKTETVFQLSDIDSVVMNQSWLGRMLNFGDVTIGFSIAREKEFVQLYAITTPQRYEDFFSKYV